MHMLPDPWALMPDRAGNHADYDNSNGHMQLIALHSPTNRNREM